MDVPLSVFCPKHMFSTDVKLQHKFLGILYFDEFKDIEIVPATIIIDEQLGMHIVAVTPCHMLWSRKIYPNIVSGERRILSLFIFMAHIVGVESQLLWFSLSSLEVCMTSQSWQNSQEMPQVLMHPSP